MKYTKLSKCLGSLLGVILLAGLVTGVKADDAPTMVISGSPGTCLSGFSKQVSFDATINNAPALNQETQLTGPTWDWSASSSGGSVSIVPPVPGTEQGSSATVSCLFNQPGTYTITVTAHALYTSTGSNPNVDVTATSDFSTTDQDLTLIVTSGAPSPNPAFVGDIVNMSVSTSLPTLPDGYTLTLGPFASWSFGTIKYREDAQGTFGGGGSYDVYLATPPDSSSGTLGISFDTVGQYQIQVLADARVGLNGQTPQTLHGEVYP